MSQAPNQANEEASENPIVLKPVEQSDPQEESKEAQNSHQQFSSSLAHTGPSPSLKATGLIGPHAQIRQANPPFPSEADLPDKDEATVRVSGQHAFQQQRSSQDLNQIKQTKPGMNFEEEKKEQAMNNANELISEEMERAEEEQIRGIQSGAKTEQQDIQDAQNCKTDVKFPGQDAPNFAGAGEMNESRSHLEDSPMISAHRGGNNTGMATGLHRKTSHKVKDLPVAPHIQDQQADGGQINSIANDIAGEGIKSQSEVQVNGNPNSINGSSILTPRMGNNLMTQTNNPDNSPDGRLVEARHQRNFSGVLGSNQVIPVRSDIQSASGSDRPEQQR